MLPLVSIITPTYNRAAFLDETIMSVLYQDYKNIEYILLDDGSTDNTAEVVSKYRSKIRFDRHLNMGEARTINKGLEMAHGEIIGVVNSDDPLLPGAVEAMAEVMANDPDVQVVYPDWYVIDEKGHTLEGRKTRNYSYLDMVRRFECLPGPGAFFRRSLAHLLGGRDVHFRYLSDFDFWLRAGLIGPFARIPKTLATFRWHSNGASSSEQGTTMSEEHIRLVDKIYSQPNLPPDVLRVKREAYSNAYYKAAVTSGDEGLDLKRQHFIKAIRLCPLKYLLEYPGKIVEPLVLITMGKRVYSAAKFIYRACHRRYIENRASKIALQHAMRDSQR